MAAGKSPRMQVLQLGTIQLAHDTWKSIGDVADIVVPKANGRAEFIAECRSGSLDGVKVAYRTFESFRITGRIDDELLSALPSSLRFICHNGAGYDQIDVAACTARGVRVSNTPTAVDEATADIHIFLLLGAMRNLAPTLSSIRAGHWRGLDGGPPLGHDPQGKTIGIVGMGGIGRTVARKAHAAFDMKVLYHNRNRLAPEVEAAAGHAVYVPTLDELLGSVDVVSINVPLNAHTRHLIGTAQFAQMKPGVVVINTARGAVIDEQALVDALASGHVAAAGLDVFEHEPQVHPELMKSDKALIVPHMGTSTVETETKMEVWAMENVRQAVLADTLKSIVPEQAGLKF
ncbi:D-3-phosphoglycerate dehydrogenase [Sporothrix schenckii 1099-18]|nr:D-3-phosphoglycerate dehydrogenase [Sporothrix schenckii 1099-18]KJR88166.1 D-3-phosphoglycerate dehydrogenase [Sporothrix schenckii 1099-18]